MQNLQEYIQIDSNIDQDIIIQSLSRYFISSSSKPLPFDNQFTNNLILTIKYLYPYFQCQFNKLKLQKHIQNLLNNLSILYCKIIQRKQLDRKILLNRFISLRVILANYNENKQLISINIDQRQLIQISLTKIDQISLDQQLYLLNKIILLGYCGTILENQLSLKLVLQHFLSLPKQHKIIEYLLINQNIIHNNKNSILNVNKVQNINNFIKKQYLRQIIIRYEDQIYKLINNLINSINFNPNHANQFIQHLIINKNIRNHILYQLLSWWSKGHQSLTIKKNCQFKTNLLALIIETINKDQLTNEGFTIFLSQGIQKRMSRTDYSRKSAIMIWVRLARCLNLQDTVKDYIGQQTLFQNQIEENIVEYQNKKVQEDDMKDKKIMKNQQQYHQQEQKINHQQEQIYIKPPKNIYDCILGLRNPNRRKQILKHLPSIMLKYPDDLTLSWLQLTQTLIIPLYDDHKKCLVTLFTLKPIQVTDTLSQRFFNGDCSLCQKILLMEAIKDAIEQLSSNPSKYSIPIQQDKDFYFKKVKSKYYNDKISQKQQQKIQKQGRVRRWGHTRIAHQKKHIKPSLIIFNNDPYINRLYQIVNSIFFKIISKLPNSTKLLKNQQFTKCILLLLSAFMDNIKNHLEKYSIINETINICLILLEGYHQKQSNNIMACVQVLMKISLTVDQFMPESTLVFIKKCLDFLKAREQYQLRPLLQAIEQNIYINVRMKIGI